MISPLRLKPSCKDYLWGGTKLRDCFGKTADTETIAESWELSCHADGPSFIDDSEETLKDYIIRNGKSILGTNCSRFSEFPVLVKLIDACDNLSVQVHPDDEYALAHEGEYGKTEMWYIVDCDEGASLLFGFDRELSGDEFRKHIENNTLLDVVKRVPVRKGDVFFIKSGTLHAIGKGIVIAEIQQNSNTTYRIYDYDRTDKNGNRRELHTDKACEVTDLFPAEPFLRNEAVFHEGYSSELLSSCCCFTVHLLRINGSASLNTDSSSFEHLLVTDGKGLLEGPEFTMQLQKGDSIFIPAGYGRYSVSGNCLIIKTRID